MVAGASARGTGDFFIFGAFICLGLFRTRKEAEKTSWGKSLLRGTHAFSPS